MKGLFEINDTLQNKISFYHLLLFFASLPFDRFYSQVILISFACHTIINFRKIDLKKLEKSRILLLTFTFILTVSFAVYTPYQTNAFKELDKQLAILLFPVLLAMGNIELAKYQKLLFQGLAISCTLTIIYLYYDAVKIIVLTGLPFSDLVSESFINHNFSSPIQIHATYLSMYAAFSLIYFLVRFSKVKSLVGGIKYLFPIAVLAIGIIQLSSKSVFIALIITCVAAPFFLYKGMKSVRAFAYSLIICGTVLVINSKVGPLQHHFFNELSKDLTNSKTSGVTDSRMKRWNAALSVIERAPALGYGSGSETDVLSEEYFSRKYYHSYLNKLNAHNQYLSFVIKFGIIGILVYLLTLGYGFREALIRRDLLFFSFLTLITIVSFSENILDVNKGIFFYSSLFSLFIFSVKHQGAPITTRTQQQERESTTAFQDFPEHKPVYNINSSILATLAYFDVFDYPLTRDEIFGFLGSKYDKAYLDPTLAELKNSRKIYAFDNFYTLKNNSDLILRRTEGNERAEKMLKTASKISGILIQFPFVRGVAVSGSLSKHFADENSDIDFFIITAPDRLWIARTLMHMFKKLTFLVNKQNLFCMNYYIDEKGLEIVEKNIYTATEIITLIPMRGLGKFQDFYDANTWAFNYLPNSSIENTNKDDSRDSWFKNIMELLFNNHLGDSLDNKFREITSRRWEKKTQLNKLNMRGIVMSMKADKHYSKPDPINYQCKLLRVYEDKVLQVTRESASVI